MWNLKYQFVIEALSKFYQKLQILPPSMTAQFRVNFAKLAKLAKLEIWRFQWFFQKFFRSLDFKKNSKTLKISILLLEFVSVLSGVAKLASDYGCSNSFSFRDMTFFWIFFIRKIRYKKNHKTWNTISVVRLCQGTLRSCEFGRRIWLLKSL